MDSETRAKGERHGGMEVYFRTSWRNGRTDLSTERFSRALSPLQPGGPIEQYGEWRRVSKLDHRHEPLAVS